MRWATRGQIRGAEKRQRRKVIDGVNGLESGEAPRHVGGVARGCQGGPQIVLLCGIDLVAGKRVEVVGKADACHVTEPWLAGTITGRRGDLRPKFRGQGRVVCVRGHDSNGRDHALLA